MINKIFKINIDILSNNSLVNEYDADVLSQSLDNFINERIKFVKHNSSLIIKINTKSKLSEEKKDIISKMIKNFYTNKINYLSKSLKVERIKEIMLIIIGSCFIGISFLSVFSNLKIIGEVLEISGWVAIWESVYKILFTANETKFRIKKLNMIPKSKIEFGIIEPKISKFLNL